ncbi:MAG: hypothetical protein R6U91_08625 [Bacillota bacterium]
MFLIKFLLITVLAAMLSIMTGGCGTLLSGEPGEEETKEEGQLPEWIQQTYRKTEGYRFDYDEDDLDLDDITEEDLVDPEVIEDMAETEEKPAEEPAEQVEEEETPVTAKADDPGDDEEVEEKPEPGSMDYIIWEREQAKDQDEQGVFDENDTWWEVDADPAGFNHQVIKHEDE